MAAGGKGILPAAPWRPRDASPGSLRRAPAQEGFVEMENLARAVGEPARGEGGAGQVADVLQQAHGIARALAVELLAEDRRVHLAADRLPVLHHLEQADPARG